MAKYKNELDNMRESKMNESFMDNDDLIWENYARRDLDSGLVSWHFLSRPITFYDLRFQVSKVTNSGKLVKLFLVNVPMLFPLENTEKSLVFWCFQ